METQQDFKELLVLLNKHAVEFIVVGAHALAFHGAPRYTGDLDVYVRPTLGNARKTMNALRDFGFGGVGLSEDDFAAPGKVVQLGYPPVRIDILTSISGVNWDEVSIDAISGAYGDIPARFISRHCFILNKRATARAKDLADVEAISCNPSKPTQ